MVSASCTFSPWMSPTQMITLCAIRPSVRSTSAPVASSALAKVCVAPNSIARSRLLPTGSITTTWRAPAAAAPCTAFMPTPPAPMTTTVSPGRTSATLVAEPQPVVTPQPTSAATSSGMSGSTLTSDASCTVMYGEKVPSRHIWMTRCPRAEIRKLPSLMLWPVSSPAPRSQRFWCPLEHGGHTPQAGMNAVTTWSPSFSVVTPGPTLVTMPAPSCPPITGSSTGVPPVTRCSSEWHSPEAASSTVTSCARGSPTSISSTDQSPPTSHSTAPLVNTSVSVRVCWSARVPASAATILGRCERGHFDQGVGAGDAFSRSRSPVARAIGRSTQASTDSAEPTSRTCDAARVIAV